MIRLSGRELLTLLHAAERPVDLSILSPSTYISVPIYLGDASPSSLPSLVDYPLGGGRVGLVGSLTAIIRSVVQLLLLLL